MVGRKVVLLLSLAAVTAGFVGWAVEDGGFSGTVGVEATFLPGFGVSCTGSLEYSFGWIDLGGTATVDVYPFAFAGFDLYAEIGLLDVAQDGFAMSADAGLVSEIYPVFGNELFLDVDASYGIFSLWSDLDVTVPAFGVSVLLGGEVRVLDLDLDGWSLTADLGASTFVVQALAAQRWFDVALEFGAVGITSETDFALTPFGLTEQRFEIEIGFDGFSVYAWGSFTGAGSLTAGVGATYSFP